LDSARHAISTLIIPILLRIILTTPLPPVETVTLLLSHRAISPNGAHPPGSRTTPLHLAASLGCADIVHLLLEQDGVDDILRDASERTARECAVGAGTGGRGREVARVFDDSHSFLNTRC
jgi:hypothetical protein